MPSLDFHNSEATKKPLYFHTAALNIWWASRESNTAPTDYESAALTKHELEARKTIILQK
jgi:hypothetical protein